MKYIVLECAFFVLFSDVVLWLQYYKENHSTAEFNFCPPKFSLKLVIALVLFL